MARASIVFISHSNNLAEGLYQLICEVAPTVDIHYTGGIEDNGIGSSFETTLEQIEACENDIVLAFYDLGSAGMNLNMASDMTEKDVRLFDVAFVEGVYTAAALLSADASLESIEEQLSDLAIQK